MRVGSLFSGCGGFDMGLEAAGMEIVWQVEYDEQAQSVLRYHWPNVDLHKDVRDVVGIPLDERSSHGDAKTPGGVGDAEGRDGSRDRIERRSRVATNGGDGRARTNQLVPVDLVCGGFPCQDLSVAGRRSGLAGERSGLFYEFMRIVDELAPRWVLIENVPGLLSSNGGRDMGAVLGTLGELGYGYAYRVLDTQFFGPPQRRRRVFLVGGSRAPCRPEVLLEPEGLPWSPAPSREAREGVARGVEGGAGEVGGVSAFKEISARKWVPSSGTWLAAHEAKEPHTLVVSDPVAFDTTQVASKASLAFHPRQDPISGPTAGCEAKGPWAVGTPAPRRLTPRECERLQGWPDDWTRYGRTLDGEVIELADTPRYRMCGNGVSAPVAEWIARRILAADGPQP